MRMLRNLLMVVIVLLIVLTTSGCDQFTAKNFGGDYTIDLPVGEKLVNITWKDTELWYLTRPMKANEEAEVYKFQEDSTLGVLEGTVTIIEHR